MAKAFPVVVVQQSQSLLRSWGRKPTLESRMSGTLSDGECIEYRPIHYPERLPFVGGLFKARGTHRFKSELDGLLAPAPSGHRIVCYDSPGQYSLVGKLKESLSVYLAIDDRTVTVTGESIPGELEGERKLLERVDRVVCVSDVLANTLRLRAGERTDLRIDVLTNGYDERLFNTHRVWNEPDALRKTPRPRILISGHVSERIDWEGIKAAAAIRPLWSWVFMGPADEGMAERVASISADSGAVAVLLPPDSYENVPAWIAHCDVCAVPYRLNNFTLASSPLKAIEYLAAGAPVLSTRIPSIAQFGEVIEWVAETDGSSYATALDELAKQERYGTTADLRSTVVHNENWGKKVERFCSILGVKYPQGRQTEATG